MYILLPCIFIKNFVKSTILCYFRLLFAGVRLLFAVTTIRLRVVFKGGYYSTLIDSGCGYNLRAPTIQGRVLIETLRYFFQLVSTYHPGKSQYSTAMRVVNQPKNRCPDLLATDSARVFLNPGGEIDGDDYINASWLMGT